MPSGQPLSVSGASFSRKSYEVDTNGRDVGLCVGVVGETKEQARLSDTGVTDEEELEEIIVSDARLVPDQEEFAVAISVICHRWQSWRDERLWSGIVSLAMIRRKRRKGK